MKVKDCGCIDHKICVVCDPEMLARLVKQQILLTERKSPAWRFRVALRGVE